MNTETTLAQLIADKAIELMLTAEFAADLCNDQLQTVAGELRLGVVSNSTLTEAHRIILNKGV